MKTTLNPFENAKRTAQGTGGVSPSVIEEIQAEITVLGSQNETQAQDITNIKAQLTELVGAYSTTEHKTGRKWIDGKEIYEATLDVGTLPNNTSKTIALPAFENVISLRGIAKASNSFLPLPYSAIDSTYSVQLGISNAALKVQTGSDRTSFTATVTVEYTKTGA